MSVLCFYGAGCASGLLIAEGEDLMERGELEQAIYRNDEALLKRHAWPQGVEDESEALSELRERLALKLNEQVILALEELRWEDACQVATEAEYLDGVSPATPSVELLSPVISELERRYDQHLMEVESWGELAFILRGLTRCAAPPALIEELLARFAVVMSISLDERAVELAELEGDPQAERAVWDALNRVEQRGTSLYEYLPRALIEAWRTQLDEWRQESAYVAFERAEEEERFGLAWALASLAGALDEAERYAQLTRQKTLFEFLTSPGDLSLKLGLAELGVPLRVAGKQALIDLSARSQGQGARLALSLEEERPSCRRSQEEVTGELRLVDHYEERPHPDWLKAMVKVERAQTHYEARLANQTQLQDRLTLERDPLVRSRLQREVDRSLEEVEVAEKRLSTLEADSEELPKVTRAPIYVVFRYPVTEWTLECEVKWSLTLRDNLSQGGEERLHWSEVARSVDQSHRAYPQHHVRPDPLRFPEPEPTLRRRAQETLTERLAEELRRRGTLARQEMYEASQRPTLALDEQESQLDMLATLALTSAQPEELKVLLELLTYALARDPRWEGPSHALSSAELYLGLRSSVAPLSP